MKVYEGSRLSWVASFRTRPNTFATCLTAMLAFFLAIGVPAPLLANPSGGLIKYGSATIDQKPSLVTINQTSSKAIINWNSFDISPGEKTQFVQPGNNSIVLNRILQNDPSQIDGQLSANGHVWLVNPNGVFFGPDSTVNVHGLLATTADITDDNFITGRYNFSIPSSNPAAAVINKGSISVGECGLAGLVAPSVRNDGIIQAHMGQVVIAGAPTFTLDFNGDGLIQFEATSKVPQGDPKNPLVANTGTIKADGGTVLITAEAAAGLVNDTINMGGLVQARSYAMKNGTIVLDGGESGAVRLSGTLDASGISEGQTGGSIKVLGEKVALAGGARIDASGYAGGGQVLIGGNFGGSGPEANAKETVIGSDVQLFGDALHKGNGGKVAIWSDGLTRFDGKIYARGGPNGGDGGFVEVSGSTLQYHGLSWLTASRGKFGTLLLDPTDFTIGTAVQGDQISAAALSAQLNVSDISISTRAVGSQPGDIHVNDAVTWTASTSLTLQAHHDININSGITGHDLFLVGSGGTIDLEAPLVMAGRLLLDGQHITQGGSGIITADSLAVRSGDFVSMTGDNQVRTLAATVAAPGSLFDFNNVIDLTVGAVDMGIANGGILRGITTNGSSVTLMAPAINLESPINTVGAVKGEVLLYSAGIISQQAAGSIKTGFLGVFASGDVSLDSSPANDVDILAARVTGAGSRFSYADSNDLTVSGQPLESGIGITTNGGNIRLTTAGALNINSLIQTGVRILGDLTINSTGPVTQAAGGSINANGLELLGAGSFTLNDPGNDINTLAANCGPLDYFDSFELTVGTVGGTTGITSAGAVTLGTGIPNTIFLAANVTSAGLQTYNSDISLLTDPTLTANGITFNGPVNGPTHNLFLVSTGPVTQITGAGINVNGLDLLGVGGSYTLTNPENAVNTLAGNTGSIDFDQPGSLIIGTVGSTSELAVTGSATIGSGADLRVNAPLSAGADVNLASTNDLFVNAAVTGNPGGTASLDGRTVIIRAPISGGDLHILAHGGDSNIGANVTAATEMDLRAIGVIRTTGGAALLPGTSLLLGAGNGINVDTRFSNLVTPLRLAAESDAGNIEVRNSGGGGIVVDTVLRTRGLTALKGAATLITDGRLTLAAPVRAAGLPGDGNQYSILLSAAGFENLVVGGTAIDPGADRFLVYTQDADPALWATLRGTNLPAYHKLYGAGFDNANRDGSGPPLDVPGIGNYFLYRFQPTLTLVANDFTRDNHNPNPAFTFTVSGLIDGDMLGNALAGRMVLFTDATSRSNAGFYAIRFDRQTFNSPLRYNLAFVDGRLGVIQIPRLPEVDPGPIGTVVSFIDSAVDVSVPPPPAPEQELLFSNDGNLELWGPSAAE